MDFGDRNCCALGSSRRSAARNGAPTLPRTFSDFLPHWNSIWSWLPPQPWSTSELTFSFRRARGNSATFPGRPPRTNKRFSRRHFRIMGWVDLRCTCQKALAAFCQIKWVTGVGCGQHSLPRDFANDAIAGFSSPLTASEGKAHRFQPSIFKRRPWFGGEPSESQTLSASKIVNQS
jgi:hypothetical protein